MKAEVLEEGGGEVRGGGLSLVWPEVVVSMFGLMVSSSSWDWYQSSLSPFLATSYQVNTDTIGLILLSPGLFYIISSTICGLILDRINLGLWAQILGTSLICVGYVLFGPIPQINQIKSLLLTLAGLAVQGAGFGFTYIGSLIYMKRSVSQRDGGSKRSVVGHVSSLWLIASNLGSFSGSLAGAAVYDTFGFQYGTFIETLVLSSSVLILIVFGLFKCKSSI